MKSVLALFALLFATGASAFTVSVPALAARPAVGGVGAAAPLFSDKKQDEEEEGSLDLDLEEMFTMFDAADKEEDFDEAIKKVKEE